MWLSGNSIAILAFITWGLLPLYFQFIPNANVFEILSIRVMFSIPCIYLLLKAMSLPMEKVWAAMQNKRILLICFLAGIFNLTSLYSFTLAVERISLIMIGFIQYIEPSIQFLLAVMIFGEILLPIKVASFILIWLGLLLCIADIIVRKRIRPEVLRL